MGKKFYNDAVGFWGPLVRKIYKIEVIGFENIPKDGNFLVCSNHLSLADVMLLGAIIPRNVRFLAKKELFSIPFVGHFIKKMGAVPVDRKGADVVAVKKMISLYESGETICVYPQGHRNPGVHPKDTEIHNGVGLISYRAKCDVLPVGFYGKGWKLRPFRKNILAIGPIIKNEELGMDEGTSEFYSKATNHIFQKILDVLTEVEK